MTRVKWQDLEAKVARDFHGKISPGSGNKWYAKSDIRNEDHRISCKQTSNSSFSIKESDISEIEKIALEDGKGWLLVIEMNGRRLVVSDYDAYTDYYYA